MKTKNKLYFIITSVVLMLFSCTDLDQEIRDELNKDQFVDFLENNDGINSLLNDAYISQKRAFSGFGSEWHLEEWSADQIFTPTRGADWSDGGAWIALHTHIWDADHGALRNSFERILQIVFRTTEILDLLTTEQKEQFAQMTVLRAKAIASTLNLWGKVPIRRTFEDLLADPEVMTPEVAYQFIVDEVTSVMSDLPDDGPAYHITKNAARALLMQVYLNKGAYLTPQSPTFDTADMDKVISLADDVIATGKYNLTCNYFDNFLTTNDTDSCENIWTIENDLGDQNQFNNMWRATLGQQQGPGGWNGFTTLSNFYDSFEANDERFYYEEPTNFNEWGLNLGLLEGQQTDQNGNNLDDGLGNPLIYTKEIELINNGPDQRVLGVRILKYNIDIDNPNRPANDYVLFRYAQVLFMKAEALYRKGDVAGATTIVNQIRNARGLGNLATTLNDTEFLKELGREFYLEGKRRTDMIRFGTFLQPFQLKETTSDPKYLKFAIPAGQVTASDNLDQNPGY